MKKSNKINPSYSESIIPGFVREQSPSRRIYDVNEWRVALAAAESEANPDRTLLYDLYEEVLLDPIVAVQTEKLINYIVGRDFRFAKLNGEPAIGISTLIDTCEFQQVLTEIIRSKLFGVSLIELGFATVNQFGEDKKKLTVYSVPRKHIKTHTKTVSKYQTTGWEEKSINYKEGQCLNYVSQIGEDYSLGCLLNVAPYVILKKGAVSDWATFVQLFGQPLRKYTYLGNDEKVRLVLEKQAQEMSSAPYIILPDGAKVELLDIRNNSNGDVYKSFVSYCDKMSTIGILGNTLTSDTNDKGTFALGTVHADTEWDLHQAHITYLLRVLNTDIIPILYNLGYDVKGGKFYVKRDDDLDSVLSGLEVFSKVKEMGLPIDSDQLYKTANISKPKNYEELKSKMSKKHSDYQPGEDEPEYDQPEDQRDKLIGRILELIRNRKAKSSSPKQKDKQVPNADYLGVTFLAKKATDRFFSYLQRIGKAFPNYWK